MENKICETVEIIARNDSEAYVKASALKVLASMVKIERFWEHSLHQLDVKVSNKNKLLKLLTKMI